MQFEHQIATIKSKADLKKWVDDVLEDDAQAIILTFHENAKRYYEFATGEAGGISWERINWIIDAFKAWIFNGDHDGG